MRLYLFVCLISLISLSFGQLSSNLPSFSNQLSPGTPFSSHSPSTTSKLSRFNPINRVIGWFRKPKNTTADRLDELNRLNPLDKDLNFNSPLASESTDKLVNDAISQHILEEGKKQEVVAGSSPFLVTFDDENNSPHERDFKDSSVSNLEVPKFDGKDRRVRSVANGPTDSIPLTEALRIVNTSSLTDCVARVICELSCNANSYGNAGRVVFRNLIKLQFDQSIKGDDAKFFRQAASKGRQLVQGKKDCNECYSIYSSCKSSSQDLVAVSSMFKL